MIQQVIQTERFSRTKRSRINFSDEKRELHLQAFYEWLPPGLHPLSFIDWTPLPSKVIACLINGTESELWAGHLALAFLSATGSSKTTSLRSSAHHLHVLLRKVTQICGICRPEELTRDAWETFGTQQELTPGLYKGLKTYRALTETHLPDYLDQLEPSQRAELQRYLLPRLPRRFWDTYVDASAIEEGSRVRRKAKSDILEPLHPFLVALIRFRKQAAERMITAFRVALAQARSSEGTFPFPFAYEEEFVSLNSDASTGAELRLEKRSVTMSFRIWNANAWVLAHPNDYHETTVYRASKGSITQPEFFVEFLGPEENLLWFGSLIRYRLLQKRPVNITDEERQQRNTILQGQGIQEGIVCYRAGVLTPEKECVAFFSRVITRSGILLFEPESLYLGVLYGAALATISLTNGSRMSELLQVSADRFKIHTYEVKKAGRPTGEQRVIHLQRLLPKGKSTEEERKLFLISDGAYTFLREIAQTLREAHGGHIPVVAPNHQNSKAEDLQPERYLFQWAADTEGKYGALAPVDMGALLRFILYGVEFATRQGEPFSVSVHLLRHVMATVARHEHDVPVEAVAYALHHVSGRVRGDGLIVASATEYYSEATEEMALMALASFQTSVEERVTTLEVGFPDEDELHQMDEELRESFERWHTLLETALGYCGNVDLCPRGYNRTLCIGCSHLVPDPRKRQTAVQWRTVYSKHAEELSIQGNMVDARQYRLLVRDLDAHLNGMEMLQAAIDDGTRKPLFLHLASAPYDEVVIDAEA